MTEIENNATYSSFMIEEIQKPAFEIFRFHEMELKEGITDADAFIFIGEGSCMVHYDTYPEKTVERLSFFFMPYGTWYEINFFRNTHLVIIRLDLFTQIQQWEDFPVLNEKTGLNPLKEFTTLHIKEILYKYLDSLYVFIKEGVSRKMFYEVKVQELFLILSEYYTQEELKQLFITVLNRDFAFANFIFKNWKKVTHVCELAALTFYTESSFNKKFKKVFGITPYKWLNSKKSSHILRELKQGNKPIKQIAEEFSFSSLQHFNTYCIRNFKQTPGEIRKKWKS